MKEEHKTYQEIQLDCHPGSPLTGVSLGYVRKGSEQAICTGRQSAGDPGQKPSGMTSYFKTSRGFTLIELLVVILIIGILAAVALPQYQLAVVKARISTYLPIMKSIVQAEKAYYLEHGTYTLLNTQLDIQLPSNCKAINIHTHNLWQCDREILMNFATSADLLQLEYCPGNNDEYEKCSAKRDFVIQFSYQSAQWLCKGRSSLGQKVCSSLALN